MKKLFLPLVVCMVVALLSLNSPSAQAAGRRMFVATPVYRTAFFNPVVPIYRPRVFVRTAAVPVIVPLAPNLTATPVVIIPPGPFGGYGFTTLPVRTTTYLGW